MKCCAAPCMCPPRAALQYTYKEVPYQVTQRTLGWHEHPDGVLRIDQQLQV